MRKVKVFVVSAVVVVFALLVWIGYDVWGNSASNVQESTSLSFEKDPSLFPGMSSNPDNGLMGFGPNIEDLAEGEW